MPKGKHVSAECGELASRLIGEGVPKNKLRRIATIVDSVGAETTGELSRIQSKTPTNSVEQAGIIATRKLILADGSEMVLDFADPAASLALVLHHNAEIRQVFQEALRRSPCGPTRPWRTVWGMDECWGGNILSVTGRKAMALSYTFMEFGKKYRAREACWFTVAVVETRAFKKLPGGWSQACRVILETFFLDELNGLARHGMLVSFQDQHILLHAKVAVVLADGDGWRQLSEAKGASGIHCCPKCTNVVSRRHLLAHAPAGSPLVDCSCADVGAFALHNFDSVHKDIKLLFRNKAAFHSGTMTKTAMLEADKTYGFSPTVEGIWGNSELARMLNLPVVLAFDWVHCVLENGVLAFEVNNYMNTCDSSSLASLENFVNAWSFGEGGRETKAAIMKVLSSWQAGHLGGHTKPSASDLLTMASLLRCWVSTHTESNRKTSLLACCVLTHEIYKSKCALGDNEDDVVTLRHARAIADAYANYMSASNRAHGAENCSGHAKKHWLGHVSLQLLQHGSIWDCFVVERLHTRVRRHSKHVRNPRRFSRSVLHALYCEHCFHTTVNINVSLMRGVPILQQVASALLPAVPTKASESCCFDGVRVIAHGDFAKLGSSTGRIVQIVETSGGDVHVMVLHCIPLAAGKGRSYLETCEVSANIVSWDVTGGNADVERASAWQVVDGNASVFLILSQP